jgi:acyl-CoA thioesterase II
MGDLANDTEVRPSGGGSYEATLSADWEIWGPMGGYVAACALRAAGAATEQARPAAFSCHYLGVADFGRVDLRVEVRRSGRTATSQRVEITQEGRPILDAMVWSVGDVEGLEHDETSPPDVPDPDELPEIGELLPDDAAPPFPFWNNLEAKPLEFEVEWPPDGPRPPGGRSGCGSRRRRPSRTPGSTPPAA